MKLKDYLIVLIFFTIIIFLPYTTYVWYIQPIDETLICDSNRNCVFEQTRFPNFKRTQTFYVYPTYKIEQKLIYNAPSRNKYSMFELTGIQHSFLFNKIEIFDYPYCIDDSYGKDCELYVNNVLSQFEEYKKSPENEFRLTSLAKERNHFGLGILLGFALWLIFAWSGYTDTEEYKKQRKKKKRKKKIKKHHNKINFKNI